MSRMSALTTLRLIGSPMNPGCPYCLPCSDCLSLARDIPTGGVGDGAATAVCCAGCVAGFDTAAVAGPLGFWGAAIAPMLQTETSHRTSAVQIADLTRG